MPQYGIPRLNDFQLHDGYFPLARFNEFQSTHEDTRAGSARNSKIFMRSAFPAGMSLIDETMAARGSFALGDVIGYFLVAITLVNEIQNRGLACARVLQFSEFFPGKNREVLRPAPRDRQNHFVGQPAKPQDSRFSCPQSPS